MTHAERTHTPIRPLVRWLATAVLCVCMTSSAMADWHRFRGAGGAATNETGALPIEFGLEKNLVWKSDIPAANSSPISTGDAIYLTASDADELHVYRLNASTGNVEWKRSLDRGRSTKVHVQNDSASPTPVTDGENVYAFFQELGVVAYNAAGDHLWTVPLDPFFQYYGMAGSPILAGDLVILTCDQQQKAFIIAIDKADGSVRWKKDRSTRGTAWSTPVAFPSTSKPESVIVHGNGWLDAYALKDGELLWNVSGFGATPLASPSLIGNRLYTTAPQWAEGDGGGFQMETFDSLVGKHDKNKDSKITKEELKGNLLYGEFGWGDADQDGFITEQEYNTIYDEFNSEDYGLAAMELDSGNASKEPEVRWRYKGRLPEISSPLVHDDTVYFVDKQGFMNSINGATGELVKRERISGARGRAYASPIAADGKIYITYMSGKVAVLQADPDWVVLAVNDLGEKITASPIVSGNRLYVRTEKSLYCFGE